MYLNLPVDLSCSHKFVGSNICMIAGLPYCSFKKRPYSSSHPILRHGEEYMLGKGYVYDIDWKLLEILGQCCNILLNNFSSVLKIFPKKPTAYRVFHDPPKAAELLDVLRPHCERNCHEATMRKQSGLSSNQSSRWNCRTEPSWRWRNPRGTVF